MQAELRKLPSVNQLLELPALTGARTTYGHDLLVETLRTVLEEARTRILDGGTAAPPVTALVQATQTRLAQAVRPTLQPVINATGVIIHTNLGRALLSERAQAAISRVAAAYSNLEYDLAGGKRGSRYVHAADLLCRLTGAEAAVVVNNNAGAVILALTALVQGREVIISRGQLVEIGGGFRIPDIMAQSGAELVEVGTTNRTYARDYEAAIDRERTGLLLAVHYSNYKITGFTTQPSLADLAEVAHRYQVPLAEDLGSGTLLDTAPFGLDHEPTIQESLAAGVDLVTASGDKLLGGPQAGLLLGRASLITRIKRHPLMRAFRVDKMTLAALQATLLAYLENRATEELPVWRMISTPVQTLKERAGAWQAALGDLPACTLKVEQSLSTVGGGSLPGQTLPTMALTLGTESVEQLAYRLRQADPPVIGRLEADKLWLDPRTVLPEQDETLVDILRKTLKNSA